MYCIHCGRKLPDDGTPCVCRAAQTPPPAAVEPPAVTYAEPAVQPEPVAQPAPAVQPEPASEPQAAAEPEPAPQAEPAAEFKPKPAAEPETAAKPQPVPAAEPTSMVQPTPAAQPAPVVEPPVQSIPAAQPAPPAAQPNGYAVQSPYVQPSPYVQQSYNRQSGYAQPGPYYARPIVRQKTPVHDAIKAAAGSPLFMVGAILMSLSLLLSVVQAFIPADYMQIMSGILQILPRDIVSAMDLDELFYEIYRAQNTPVASTVISLIPSLAVSGLTLAGLWITFVSGRDKKSPYLKTSGLTILKVLQIIDLVFLCIGALLLVVLLIVLLIAVATMSSGMRYSSAEAAAQAVMTVAIVIMVACVALVAVTIVYSVKVIGSLNAVKKAVDTGVAAKKASMFVAVVNFILAGFSLLDLYGIFVFNGWFGLLTTACTAATQIVFGICIIQYNKRVKALAPQPAQGYLPQQN